MTPPPPSPLHRIASSLILMRLIVLIIGTGLAFNVRLLSLYTQTQIITNCYNSGVEDDRGMAGINDYVNGNTSNKIRRVFVNFAFCHTSDDRLENLKFFLRNGVTVPHHLTTEVHYGLVVNGECRDPACSLAGVSSISKNDDGAVPNIRVIHRENIGFDLGQHTVMLEELEKEGLSYDAYIFLNAGVTGPFIPSYMPAGWHWVNAFTDKLVGNVGIVSTSIVCLPHTDRSGFGPKAEAFAFAMTARSLQIARTHGTSFRQHRSKGAAVLDGEYALTKTVFEHGMTIDTLLMAYKGVKKWEPNMACNNFVHPTRHGTYFGIEVHPLETLFHKNDWKHDGRHAGPVLGEEYFRTYKDFVDGKHLPTTLSLDALEETRYPWQV